MIHMYATTTYTLDFSFFLGNISIHITTDNTFNSLKDCKLLIDFEDNLFNFNIVVFKFILV